MEVLEIIIKIIIKDFQSFLAISIFKNKAKVVLLASPNFNHLQKRDIDIENRDGSAGFFLWESEIWDLIFRINYSKSD